MSNWSLDRRTFLKTSGVAGATMVAGGVPASGRAPGPKEDEVLVGVSAGAGDVTSTVARHVPGDAEIVHENDALRYVAVKFPEQAADVARRNFVDAITEKDGIKYAEPNATYEALYAPDDPQFGSQYVPQQVGADAAWDVTLGSHDVTVAIVDTGVQYDHPDLDGNVCGRKGRDFVDGDDDPYPDVCEESHGTHVAGVVAAETDNGTGIAGIGQSCLLSCRALDESGSGSAADIADAIEWAADEGADVVNLSLGAATDSDTIHNAVAYAADQGSLLVGAAGASASEDVNYPAAYGECVAVSAVDSSEQLAGFSSYGPEIELCAPGVDVLTLSRTCGGGGDGYPQFSGTSFSTAAVSGVAGLTLAEWDLTSAELRAHLKDTARDVGLPSDEQGSGHVDAHAAVTTDPDGGGDDPGGPGDSVSETIADSLSGYWDYDDWTWEWEFTYGDTTQVEVALDGPSDADFDLYVNTGTTTPASPSDHDYASTSPDSQEYLLVEDPDTSTPMQVDVDSYTGSGSYDLTITEYS